MDLEAPADAWYVFIGVSLISVAVAGVALGFPTGLEPDAGTAMTQINEVAGSEYDEKATQEHNADLYWVDSKRIGLKNDFGTSRATVSFGTIAPVYHNESLQAVLAGQSAESQFGSKSAFQDAVTEGQQNATVDGERQWRSTDGELRAKKVTWGDYSVTLVAF